MSKPRLTVKERVLRYAQYEPSGCLVWYKAVKKNGRPYIQVDGRCVSAYRALWEAVNGPIGKDMTIDHLCFNKACLNLEHMEVVTHSLNIHRGLERLRNINPLFTCGHRRDGDTAEWYGRKDGKRRLRCRPCYLVLLKKHNDRRRELKNASANDLYTQ